MEREEATTSTSEAGVHVQQQHKEDDRGAGGKLRKPFERKPHYPKPYDRPPNQNQHGGWLNYASRLISGATGFFPSLFSKQSLLISPADTYTEEQSVGEEKQAATDEELEVFHDIQITSPLEGGQVSLEAEVSKHGSYMNVSAGNTLHRASDGSGVSEIEQMLKGKTLSRGDFIRLTDILKSRIAVQSDVDDFGKRNSDATTAAEAAVAPMGQKNLKGPDDEKEAVYLNRYIGESSTPFPQSTSRDLVGASPIDIAKAYMGTRTSELGVGGPSVVSKEETTFVPASGILSKSYLPPPTPKSSICWPGSMVQHSQSYLTPQTERVRVGLYTNTPYARSVQSRSTFKLEGGGGRSRNILSTNLKQLQTPVYGGNQVTEASISSLNNSFGSAGPIRRMRRKFHGTKTPSKGTHSSRPSTSGHFWEESFDASNDLMPMVNQNLEAGTSARRSTTYQSVDAKTPSGVGLSTVHPHSSDMARKILEHLDRTVPTPEKKFAELKSATSWRNHSLSESTSSIMKVPVSNPFVESSESLRSSHILPQKFFDQETEVGGTFLLSDQPEQRNPGEATNVVNKKTLGSSVFSSEFFSGRSAAQVNTKLSTESKETPELEVIRNEVPIRHNESVQSEKNHLLPQQSEVGGQAFSRFAGSDAVCESLNVPKKLSAHTFGNKPPLASISVAKPDPKCRVSFDNCSGFTFPVSASSGSLFEPPTPSLMPSFLAPGLPKPKENRTIPPNNFSLKQGEPSYSFGSKTSGCALVFSFPSSSSSTPSDCLTPTFTFGSDKARTSFRSVGEDAVCS